MAGSTMDMQVRITAIDRYSKTIDRFHAKLKSLDGGRGAFARPGDGAGDAYFRSMERRSTVMQSAQENRAAHAAGAIAPMGLSAGIVGAGALGLGMKEAVTAAADFESSLTGIQKKAGTTAEQTTAIGEEIKDLATNGQLAVPIEEIAAAYERGAAAGIPLSELKQFATLSAKAADAFEMSAKEVGDAAAGFNTVLKVPMAGMERYFDLINGLADSGIADESGIVDFIDQAGSMSKTFGLSAEQTAALGATLLNLKVPAAKAATAMNSILANLTAPDSLSSDGKFAFENLIGDTKRFAKTLKTDAKGALIEVVDKLALMDDAKRTETIVELFGKDHLDVMQQLVEGSDNLKKNMGYAGGTDWFGSLDKSYKIKLDDMWSQWQVFKNQIGELLIDVGTAGMPAFKASLEGAKALVGQIGKGFEAFQAKIDMTAVGNAGGAISDLGTAIGKLLGVDTSQSALPKFFSEMADAANQIADGVNAVDAYLDPEKAVDRIPDQNELTPDQQAQRRAYMSRFMPDTWAELQKRNATDPTTMGSGKTGLRTPYGPSAPQLGMDQGRFGPPPPPPPAASSAMPIAFAVPPQAEIDAMLAAYQAVRAQVAAPMPTPTIETLPATTSLDTLKAAAAAASAPISAVADVNISPALAKLDQLAARARQVSSEISNSISSAGSRGGDEPAWSYNARVRDQF